MSEYLLTWLNNEITLSKPVINIPKEFYTGYLFGEVIYKLNIINENEFKASFLNTRTYEDIIKNFQNLSIFLKKIDLDLPSNFIQPIMNKDIVAAANVLYKIKKGLDRKKINFNKIRTSQDGVKLDDEEMKKKIINLLDGKSSNENTIENDRYQRTIEKAFQTKSKIDSVIKQKSNLEIINDNSSNNNNINSNEEEKKKEPPQEEEEKNEKTPLSRYQYHRNAMSQILKPTKKIDNEEDDNTFKFNVFQQSMQRMGLDINFQKMNTLNGKLNFDMSQDIIMKKLKEQLKERMEMKKENELRTSKKIKEELKNNFFNNDIPPDEINFLKREKNPLIPKRIYCTAFSTVSLGNTNKSQTFRKRLEYEKQFNLAKKNKIIAKRIDYFRSLILRQKKQPQSRVIKLRPTMSTEEKFNSNFFFTSLNNKSLDQSVKESQIRIKTKDEDTPLMKKIIYQMIELAEECYEYQKSTKEDNLHLDLFKKWNNMFINNIPLVNIEEDLEAKQIKQSTNDDEQTLDMTQVPYTETEENEVLDYLCYVGNWDHTQIIPNKDKGKKINYEFIVDNYKSDFEPTTEEIDDATVPKNSSTNYQFGEIVDMIVDQKLGNERNQEDFIKEVSEGKWEHIPFKICLLGYPLSGKKTLARKIKEKYQNIKIYSVNEILQDYVKEWENINTPVENLPKFKSMKKNQIDEYKSKQEEKIAQFKPKYEMIQSFIENKEITDEMLFNLLIKKVEEDFPFENISKTKEEIMKRRGKISTLEANLATLKEQNATSKKPKIKEEQAIEKEIQSLLLESYSGFIVTDFPQNISQSFLLEHYLTGYEDQLSKPKTEKQIIMSKLSKIVDQVPKKGDTSLNSKSGIDCIINLNTPSNVINERYEKIKYDPVNNVIYTEKDLSTLKLDKKVLERLTSDIPELNKENFEKLMKNYNLNYVKIKNFYDSFVYDENQKILININCDEYNEKDLIVDYVDNNILKSLFVRQEKKEKEMNSIEDKETEKEPQMNQQIKENNNNDIILNNNNNSNESNETEKDIIINFEVPQKKNLTKKKISSYNVNEQNCEIYFNEIMSFDEKYILNTKFFVYRLEKQKKEIITRINLIQKQFKKYLNKKTNKKDLINIYISKYNDFHSNHLKFMTNPTVIKAFNKDIIDLNDKLWEMVQEKKLNSIDELEQIKSSGFIENELRKFYTFIVDQFKIETEKFLIVYKITTKYFNLPIEIDLEDLYQSDCILKFKNQVKQIDSNEFVMEEYISNIENIYLNCFNLIFKLNEYINQIETNLKNANINNNNESITSSSRKRLIRKKNTNIGDNNVTINTNNTKCINNSNYAKSLLDEIKQIIKLEKIKYKFRVTLLKNFSSTYITKIFTFTKNVYEKLDNWIILSVYRQNERINMVIEKLKRILEQGIPINDDVNDENKISTIELDDFSKDENYYDVIDTNKLLNGKQEEESNTEFNYDASELFNIYQEIKTYKIEENIIGTDVFFEIFVKKYLFSKNENIKGICQKMKKLSSKDNKKIFSLFKTHKNDDYINFSEVFTFIALAGVEVITEENFENLEKNFGCKLINGNLIKKEEFYEYKFWFEKENDTAVKDAEFGIKDLIYNIWKVEDDGKELFNFSNFIGIINNKRYFSETSPEKIQKYFDYIYA